MPGTGDLGKGGLAPVLGQGAEAVQPSGAEQAGETFRRPQVAASWPGDLSVWYYLLMAGDT